MRKDVYDCDRCGLPIGEHYNPETDQTVLVIRESEQFVGSPECSYERKDICHSCLAKAMREWFYRKAREGRDKTKVDTFDFTLAKQFCEILEEKEE